MRSLLKIQLLGLCFGVFWSCQDAKPQWKPTDTPVNYKHNAQIEAEVAKDTTPWKYQISASTFASKGAYKKALEHWDLAMPSRARNYSQAQSDSLKALYKPMAAMPYILERAKSHQIVMINEAHHSARHRMFTKELLTALYEQGFRYLGLEALSYEDDMSALRRRGYPIAETGYYIKDPQFGNMIRTALKLGYTLFPYESQVEGNGSPQVREEAQARNIQKLLETNPDAKMLIHCGFDHNLEGTHPSWGVTMASLLSDYTDINPLTINQTAYAERANTDWNAPLTKVFSVTESSVLVDSMQTAVPYKRKDAWNDMAVLHPQTHYKNGRPEWQFTKAVVSVSVDLSTAIGMTYPAMVLAYKKGELLSKAVPVDIAEIQEGTTEAQLVLEPGIYELLLTDGAQTMQLEVEVKASEAP